MAHCSSCSAPLPPSAITCDYCGTRNDIDLKGVHYYTTHETDSERPCPRCGIALKTIDLKLDGTFLIERCDRCFGLFFDPGELEALLSATVANVFEINRKRLDNNSKELISAERAVSYVKCPVCSKIMNRVNFGVKSGVVVDRCRNDGVWLDGGELRHLFEWMKAGGKLLDQERKEQLKKEESAQEREQRQKITAMKGDYSADSSFDLFGGTLKSSDPDFFDIIHVAMRFFMR